MGDDQKDDQTWMRALVIYKDAMTSECRARNRAIMDGIRESYGDGFPPGKMNKEDIKLLNSMFMEVPLAQFTFKCLFDFKAKYPEIEFIKLSVSVKMPADPPPLWKLNVALVEGDQIIIINPSIDACVDELESDLERWLLSLIEDEKSSEKREKLENCLATVRRVQSRQQQ